MFKFASWPDYINSVTSNEWESVISEMENTMKIQQIYSVDMLRQIIILHHFEMTWREYCKLHYE